MKTKIYGASDDLVEIDGEVSEEYNNCRDAEKGFPIEVSDGTKASIVYGKGGNWEIEVKHKGQKYLGLIKSVGDDAEHILPDAVGCSSYSDVLVFDEGIEWVKINRNRFTR